MGAQRGLVRAVVAAGLIGLATPAGGRADDGGAPPRPGQVRAVLSALKADGDALAGRGAGWLLKREYLAHLMYLATDTRGNIVGSGMYHPAQVRYGWEWLQKHRDRNGDGAVSLAEFGGPREWFEALDRDRDGALTKDDFDWAAGSPLAAAQGKASALFGRIDRDGNGRATPNEWKAWFDAVGGAKGYVGQDDLIPLFLEKKQAAGKGPPPVTRGRLQLICAYLSGDVGPLSDGPALGEAAPDFTLPTADGKDRLAFSQRRGGRPQVLVFGSFTCNRFRAQSGDVEDVYRRYKDKADFVAVYVREAHPTDGWALAFNEKVGISIPQSKVFEERRAAAATCGQSLKMTIPMVVDEIDDRAGIAYCGMPDRLYVLDAAGRVAYKGGRGPFGFKPLEMEQALVLLLAAESPPPAGGAARPPG
ncbi:MAG TPA: deiodinase family protein [Urbifossiella sp.]|jgi:hypothetical protein|nr:deiodinase family protein [Urbifossiella sp.]